MIRSLNFWLFLVVLICAVSLWSAMGGPALFQRQAAVPPLSPAEAFSLHLRVVNGVGVPGLARDFGLLLARDGCVVEGLGNAEGDWSESVLVNRRLADSQAEALAARLGGVALIHQWDARCREDALLILGQDHPRIRAALKPDDPGRG